MTNFEIFGNPNDRLPTLVEGIADALDHCQAMAGFEAVLPGEGLEAAEAAGCVDSPRDPW
jgi:hypothetical protein